MVDDSPNPSRDAALAELIASAVATYGEERASEAPLRAALESAATAAWRVMQETLDPLDPGPLPGG